MGHVIPFICFDGKILEDVGSMSGGNSVDSCMHKGYTTLCEVDETRNCICSTTVVLCLCPKNRAGGASTAVGTARKGKSWAS